jgi:AbiJ N-terminal domain 4
MKRLLFTERMTQPKPRVAETLDGNVRAALFQIVQSRIESNWFGSAFPLQCPDGSVNAGTDLNAQKVNMAAFHVVWPDEVMHKDTSHISDSKVFDLIEYSFENIARPMPKDYHSFFSHHHYDYDQPSGRQAFAEEINRLFEHNGLAYQLREGQVERLTTTVLQQVLAQTASNTGDITLNDLLNTARDKFLNRELHVRREALEKLWDAWERLKSLSDPNDKKRSTQLLLDKTVAEPQLRQRIELEAKQVTEIGNSFFIRHTEVTKPHIVESAHVDYLFHRLFSLIRLILQAHGVQM